MKVIARKTKNKYFWKTVITQLIPLYHKIKLKNQKKYRFIIKLKKQKNYLHTQINRTEEFLYRIKAFFIKILIPSN